MKTVSRKVKCDLLYILASRLVPYGRADRRTPTESGKIATETQKCQFFFKMHLHRAKRACVDHVVHAWPHDWGQTWPHDWGQTWPHNWGQTWPTYPGANTLAPACDAAGSLASLQDIIMYDPHHMLNYVINYQRTSGF